MSGWHVPISPFSFVFGMKKGQLQQIRKLLIRTPGSGQAGWAVPSRRQRDEGIPPPWGEGIVFYFVFEVLIDCSRPEDKSVT
jgi:hypothetical protein